MSNQSTNNKARKNGAKILFCSNNAISHGLIDWLIQEGEAVTLFSENLTKNSLNMDCYDFLISYNYRHILKKEVLELFSKRAINLHISLLPWNRGADPNIWSFLENSPKGVTIHLMDEGIDTGKILVQKQVLFDEEKETIKSSYMALHNEIQKLFKSNWQRIKIFQIEPRDQPPGGSFHKMKDINAIKTILDEEGWDIKISTLRDHVKLLLKEDTMRVVCEHTGKK